MNALQLEYERDFYSWIYQTIELLKQRQFAAIDIDILIDELESMAKRDKRELVSRLMILIAHLLKWQFQPHQRSASWRGSIREQRIQIMRQLEESPSLKSNLEAETIKSYPKAVDLAATETGLPTTIFPKTCQYSIEQLLDKNFYPSAN